MREQLDRAVAEVALELPPMAEFVGTGRMVVASLARHYGFGDEQIEDLRIAVSEAITNAVRSHIEAGVPDAVHVVASMEGDALTVTVEDRAGGLPAPEPDVGATPHAGDLEAGLGVSLIRALIPEATIEPRAGEGTTIRMVLKREGAAG